MERLYKPKDVQSLLGCSLTKVYTIIGQDDFPKMKIGRNYYIPESALERWIRNYTGKEYVIN